VSRAATKGITTNCNPIKIVDALRFTDGPTELTSITMPKAVEHYSIHEPADYAHVKVLFTGMKTLTQRFQTATRLPQSPP